jgi:hypothetical protein
MATEQESWTGAGEYTWTVPKAVSSIDVDLRGGAGGNGNFSNGGDGGRVQGTMSVTPGEQLIIRVGGGGGSTSGGYNGGGDPGDNYRSAGGGGASEISTNSGTPIAGGGGGGGGHDSSSDINPSLEYDSKGQSGDQNTNGTDGETGGQIGKGGTASDFGGNGGGVSTTTSMAEATGNDGSGGGTGGDGAQATDYPGNDIFIRASSGGGGGGAGGGGSGGVVCEYDFGDSDENELGVGGSAGGTHSTSGLSSTTVTDSYNGSGSGAVYIEYEAPPEPVQSVSAIVDGADIVVDWGPTEDTTSYNVYRNTKDDAASSTLIAEPTDDQYTDTPPDEGRRYYYWVSSESDVGETDTTGPASVVTALPAPTGLSHSNEGDESVEYSWTANHSRGETRVEYREDGKTDWQTFSTVPYSTETETVTGLLNGQLYESRVVAQTDDATAVDE